MNNILVSFSGGKTSAYMSYLLKKNNKQDNLYFVFANTGQESEESLEFTRKCDEEFNLNLVWVEAVVNAKKGEATSYKTTNFKEAHRGWQLFEDVISKYGIPNKSYPHCNRELKLAPIHSWAKENIGDYKTAIGIRTDEIRRVSKGNLYNIIYPLINDYPTDKIDVNNFWEDMSFNLEIPPYLGNCVGCWKKSDRKLIMIAQEYPELFNTISKIEADYRHSGSDPHGKGRTFFRQNRNAKDILKLAGMLTALNFHDYPDENDGCSESCEIYEMDEK